MRIYQRKGVWYIDYSFNGRRLRKAVGRSKKIADLALKKVELEIARGEFLGVVEPKKVLFDKLCEEYLIFSKANKASSSYERDQLSIKHWLQAFHGKLMTEVSSYELESYKNRRRDEVAPATVNRELSCIKHMFNKAVQWGYLTDNPIRNVTKFKEPPGRVRYLTDEEIERLLNCCSEHIRSIVVTVLNTGMRKGEILNLKWSDVDMKNRIIIIRKTKNNETRIMPMNDTVCDVLDSIGPGILDKQVFTDQYGRDFKSFKKGFCGALRRANIKDFRFHDLRHTFASRLAMAGTNMRTVQELLGHKDIRMAMRYSHLSDVHLKEAVKKLELGTNMAHALKRMALRP